MDAIDFVANVYALSRGDARRLIEQKGVRVFPIQSYGSNPKDPVVFPISDGEYYTSKGKDGDGKKFVIVRGDNYAVHVRTGTMTRLFLDGHLYHKDSGGRDVEPLVTFNEIHHRLFVMKNLLETYHRDQWSMELVESFYAVLAADHPLGGDAESWRIHILCYGGHVSGWVFGS